MKKLARRLLGVGTSEFFSGHEIAAVGGTKLHVVRPPVLGILISCGGRVLKGVLGATEHAKMLLEVDTSALSSGRELEDARGTT